MIYVLLNSFIRLGVFIYFFNNLDQTDRSTHWFDFILVLLGTFISLWISKIIYKFVKLINVLEPNELYLLKSNRIGTQRRIVVW